MNTNKSMEELLRLSGRADMGWEADWEVHGKH
jgi:hypothetical protein